MTKIQKLIIKLFFSICVLITLASVSCQTASNDIDSITSIKQKQIKENSTISNKDREDDLQPLTEEERSLDFQKLLSNQPDFVADEILFYNEGFGGISLKSRVAKKDNRYVVDTGYVKVITEDNRVIRLDDSSKTFDESVIKYETILNNGLPLNAQTLAKQENIKLIPLGTQVIDNHKTIKVEAKLENQTSQVFLYFAKDLNYLIIVIQVGSSQQSSVQRLQNISLDVPNGLVDIPPDYKSMPKYKWSRVDSAKVFYGGQLQKEYSVFRSADGNQLFVTLYEPHPDTGLPWPWHYLVFLKEQIAEIGYQEMLITNEGELAWESKSKEATSSGDTKSDKDNPLCESKKCPKTVVGTNFVQFPSVYYEDRKSIVKVIW